MKCNLIKVGATGSIVVAVCCFTPVLVVVFGMLGLSTLVGYLDYVLFPALAIFLVILAVGLVLKYRHAG